MSGFVEEVSQVGTSRRSRSRRVGVGWIALTVALAVVAGVGAAAGSGATAAKPAVPKPLSAAAWQAVVAKAKQEGTVTIYTVGAPANYANLAKRFKEIYGIDVVVNRKVDNDLLVQINAEQSTGKAVADIWVPATKGIVLGALNNGWVVDAVGPNFFLKRFDRKKLMVGKGWIPGSALLGMSWNTQCFPQGIKDIPDFLNPAFKGKLGVSDPRISPAQVDWYQWLEKTYGNGIIEKLAAQKPRIYGSSLTAAQAVASGEICGAPQAAGSTTLDLKAKGAPVEYRLANKGNNWNAAYIGLILKQAPHPNAAQLLANFIVSPEGQALHNFGLGAIYKNVPGTFYSPPRVARSNDLAPAKVKAFIERWSKLFL
jgi:iron(III) transport system substrate-binding protein